MNNKNAFYQSNPRLSPKGHLYLSEAQITNIKKCDKASEEYILASTFIKNYALGVLYLSLKSTPKKLSKSLSFWRAIAHLFMHKIQLLTKFEDVTDLTIPCPPEKQLQEYVDQAPFFQGSEYLNQDVLKSIWKNINRAYIGEAEKYNMQVPEMLKAHKSNWHLVGQICFHLAENKSNSHLPFAFIATFSPESTQLQPKHLPLNHALSMYAQEKNNDKLLLLLKPIYQAAKKSSFLKELIDSGRIFKPNYWTATDAYEFLKDICIFENSNIVIRVPNWWNPKNTPKPKIKITLNQINQGQLGFNELVNFNINQSLPDGTALSTKDWQYITQSKESLIKVKGQWVEVDHEKINMVLDHWKMLQSKVKNGLSFTKAMQLLSGMPLSTSLEDNIDIYEWSYVHAEKTLTEKRDAMLNPALIENPQIIQVLAQTLQATLRPYQEKGVEWLYLLYSLKLGGCLADDMGLGKTMQLLALFLIIKSEKQRKKGPHLLIVPASLLSNWQQEISRFAPSLYTIFLHPQFMQVKNITESDLIGDLVVTTYNFAYNLPLLTKTEWDIIALDEAQAIKNPNAKQTKGIKNLKSNIRFTLTGTPIENSLGDMWSLFDFFAPGLLGPNKIFTNFIKQASASNANPYKKLRSLISPYILRRLKTDKSIIQDLPDKTEITTYCNLSIKQIALYKQSIDELRHILASNSNDAGIQRRGIILSFLMRLKQICNHPAHWLGYGTYAPSESGKFLQLKEICETIAKKQEKVLIFTQYREVIEPIAEFLSGIFKRPGLILHGGTPVKKRGELVKAFAQEDGPPFFVLSLKAGGTGLTLTQASHVIHFDRWWNPAVENQATDRAFRIGQHKNVMVHKFVSSGTLEEKIDRLIQEKKMLSDQLLGSSKEMPLTELSDQEILQMVSLDINKIM